MGYDHFFRFIKDDLIDPNIAFIQNVDNFLFCIYFNYLERYESDIKKERNRLLANLFRNIKNSLMSGYMDLGNKKINIMEKVEEIQKEKDEEKRKFKLLKLEFNIKWSFMYPNIIDELIDLKFKNEEINHAEIQVNLILYCILVNGLNKTKGEKFNQIKKEMEPLTKILKEIFCEFDKNEIHKERTFIFPLRSPKGSHDDFHIINNKDDMLRKYNEDDDNGEIECMFLRHTNNDKDFLNKFINGVIKDYYLEGKKEYNL